MPIKVTVKSLQVPLESKRWFGQCARVVFREISTLRRRAGAPASWIEVLLVDNFEAEVRRLSGQQSFTMERAGGQVAAKCLPQTDDGSRILIVFDANNWVGLTEPGKATQIFFMAHELAHSLIGRIRVAAGLPLEESEPTGGAELARHLSRTYAEEYWVQFLADVTVGAMVSTICDGQHTPVRGWDLLGERYMTTVFTVLHNAYPTWADTVDRYRHQEVDLETMWSIVGRAVHQTVVSLITAQAVADRAGVGNLHQLDFLAELPASRIYLTESWARFLQVLRDSSILCRAKDFREREEQILAAGERMLVEIWDKLGVRFSKLSGDQYWLGVTQPAR